MRRMQYVLAVMTVAALGTLVTYAQAPQQPAAGAPAPVLVAKERKAAKRATTPQPVEAAPPKVRARK